MYVEGLPDDDVQSITEKELNINMKKLFPISYKNSKGVVDFIVGLLTYIAIGIIAGVAIWLATALVGWVPLIGSIIASVLGLVSTLIAVYVLIGIVLLILAFLKVIK